MFSYSIIISQPGVDDGLWTQWMNGDRNKEQTHPPSAELSLPLLTALVHHWPHERNASSAG